MGDTYAKRLSRYPGYYITTDGRVISVRGKNVRELSRYLDNYGYLRVKIQINHNRKHLKIHRLLAEAFIQGEPKHVRHLDGNPANNSLSNLQWGTPKQNAEDMVKHGRAVKGVKSVSSKLSHDDVKVIRALFDGGETQREIANLFDISGTTAWQIKSRRKWSHV